MSRDDIGRGTHLPPADWKAASSPDTNPDSPVSPFPRTPAIVQPYADALVTIREEVAELVDLLAHDVAAFRRTETVLNANHQTALTHEADRLELTHNYIKALVAHIEETLHFLEGIE